jgi:hypothetical protein
MKKMKKMKFEEFSKMKDDIHKWMKEKFLLDMDCIQPDTIEPYISLTYDLNIYIDIDGDVENYKEVYISPKQIIDLTLWKFENEIKIYDKVRDIIEVKDIPIEEWASEIVMHNISKLIGIE